MSAHNTASSFGSITKVFHWLTALLILSIFPVGIIANNLAEAISTPGAVPDDSQVALTKLLFSVHKTLGVTIFFLALTRIFWAFGQRKSGLINGDHRLEALAAETVHWLLYGSLVAVPLTGWIHHAATTGFAPIWWPFGQDLPYVPKDGALADLTSTLHYVLQWVLAGAVGLHIAGALKHHVIDRDATLRRMLPGRNSGLPTERQPGHALPFVTALAIWAAAIVGAAGLGWFSSAHNSGDAASTTLADVQTDWLVQNGQLKIVVQQLGADVTGSFADWTAAIQYDETPDADGRHGDVVVTIAIASLSLGTVTSQATGAGYLDAGAFSTATFAADIVSTDTGPIARGTLTIKDISHSVEMPFALTVDKDKANASGSLTIDRRIFGVGDDVKDESSLGFNVDISFELTATREASAN